MALIDNLISHWDLDEASGNAVDSVGSNTLTNHGTTSGTGLVNALARDFEYDSTQYLSLANSIADDVNLSSESFEFATWVKRESNGSNFPMILAKDDVSGHREFGLYYDVGGGVLTFECSNNVNGSGLATIYVGSPMTIGTWYLVFCGRNAETNRSFLKIDSGGINTAVSAAVYTGGGADFNIGGRIGTNTWDGLIGPCSFWRGRCLSGAQRTALYNNGAGLVFPWVEDESSDDARRRMLIL